MPSRSRSEEAQALLDLVSTGRLDRRRFLVLASAAGLTACYSAPATEHAVAAGENQARNQAAGKDSYDYIVVGAGAAGSVVAGELSKTGANVLVVEAGGADDAPTISNPSVWFRNVGGPLDWHLAIAPDPQLNNRKFNMALGHVLGGGSSINALVWSRGMDLDYDSWARNGATGWAFKDVLPMFKSQEDWEGGANDWRGVGGPIHLRNVHNPHPTSPALIEAARQMGMPVIDDMNGPMRPGAGYNNMNIAPDGSRVSAARAFLRPNLGRPNLTLLLNVNVTKVVFEGDRAIGVEIAEAAHVRTVRATREVILSAGTIHTAQLLMLSGIGNATNTKSWGSPPSPISAASARTCRTTSSCTGLSTSTRARCRTVRWTATPPTQRSSCRAVIPVIQGTSSWCWSNSLPRPPTQRRDSARRRRKVSPSPLRSSSRPAAARFGSRPPIGATRPSSKPTTSARTRTWPPSFERSRRPASSVVKRHSTTFATPRSSRARTPPASKTCSISRGPPRPASGTRSAPPGSARTRMPWWTATCMYAGSVGSASPTRP